MLLTKKEHALIKTFHGDILDAEIYMNNIIYLLKTHCVSTNSTTSSNQKKSNFYLCTSDLSLNEEMLVYLHHSKNQEYTNDFNFLDLESKQKGRNDTDSPGVKFKLMDVMFDNYNEDLFNMRRGTCLPIDIIRVNCPSKLKYDHSHPDYCVVSTKGLELEILVFDFKGNVMILTYNSIIKKQ
jgi:hypothetical protein